MAEMKLLTNSNGSYLTGDEIADAVLHYGLLLTRRHDVDLVNVPFVDNDGAVHRVELTIGWQSQTTAVSNTGPTDELLEVDTILDIYGRADSLTVIRAQPFTDEQRDELLDWPSFDEDQFG
jgi:hypothetical protein